MWRSVACGNRHGQCRRPRQHAVASYSSLWAFAEGNNMVIKTVGIAMASVRPGLFLPSECGKLCRRPTATANGGSGSGSVSVCLPCLSARRRGVERKRPPAVRTLFNRLETA